MTTKIRLLIEAVRNFITDAREFIADTKEAGRRRKGRKI